MEKSTRYHPGTRVPLKPAIRKSQEKQRIPNPVASFMGSSARGRADTPDRHPTRGSGTPAASESEKGSWRGTKTVGTVGTGKLNYPGIH
eukprot:125199-Rhodomonas_salina.1